MTLRDTILALEDTLLHGDFSNDRASLEALLNSDFREVNPEGQVVSRESVINWLLAKEKSHRWLFSSFEVKDLGAGLALATYHARQTVPENPESNGAVHASLWINNAGDNNWQLLFHQSTRLK